MVFGILSAAVAVPAVIGTTEAVRQGQRQNAREEHRGRKGELVAALPAGNAASGARRRAEFDGSRVVLWRGRKLKNVQLYIHTNPPHPSSPSPLQAAHPFTGYLLPHPHAPRWREAGHSPQGEGLVSTVSDDPPVLNWIYVHPLTHEICYGTRAEVDEVEGVAGPWDVTAGVGTDRGTGLLGGGRRMTFEGWEGFVAVEVEVDFGEGDEQGQLWADEEEKDYAEEQAGQRGRHKVWALYFDRADDGLSSEGRVGAESGKYNMLEVELLRSERRRTRQAAVEERVDRLKHRIKVDERNENRKEERQGGGVVVVESSKEE